MNARTARTTQRYTHKHATARAPGRRPRGTDGGGHGLSNDSLHSGQNSGDLDYSEAINAAFEKLIRMPRWLFRLTLWRHRNGPIARMLRESGAAEIIKQRIQDGR